MSKGPDPVALGLAGGLLWGAALFLGALAATMLPAWQPAVNAIGTFYLGYAATLPGAVIGAIWGFADVFIGLYAFAWLYQYFAGRPWA